MNFEEQKLWGVYKELIWRINCLFITSVALRENRDPENIPADLKGNSQSIEDMSERLRECLSGDLIGWFQKHSQTFQDWSKKFRELSYSNMAGLTEAQQCQKMIDALDRFEPVMEEGNKLAKAFVFEGKEDMFPEGISDWLSTTREHYKDLRDFLRK